MVAETADDANNNHNQESGSAASSWLKNAKPRSRMFGLVTLLIAARCVWFLFHSRTAT
jgi:hypothetical protein